MSDDRLAIEIKYTQIQWCSIPAVWGLLASPRPAMHVYHGKCEIDKYLLTLVTVIPYPVSLDVEYGEGAPKVSLRGESSSYWDDLDMDDLTCCWDKWHY